MGESFKNRHRTVTGIEAQMVVGSSSTPVPGLLSSFNDRSGRIFGARTLEANWYEERTQKHSGSHVGVLDTSSAQTKLHQGSTRSFESDVSCMTPGTAWPGHLLILSRYQRVQPSNTAKR